MLAAGGGRRWDVLLLLLGVVCVVGAGVTLCPPTALSGLRAGSVEDWMPQITKRSRAPAEAKVDDIKPSGLKCPIEGCGRSRSCMSNMRTHLNKEHSPFVLPGDVWMKISDSKACPSCAQGVVALTKSRCCRCPNVDVKESPRIAHLPSIALRTDVAQISLQTVSSAQGPDWSFHAGSCEQKVAVVYDKQLLSICFTNAPLLKVIPKREAGWFARTWSGLLLDALDKRDVGSWFDFFRFPKCILLAPVRGGRRVSRSQSIADLVHARLKSWPAEKDTLWESVLVRCQRSPRVSSPVPNLEKSVVAALRAGDVRKALQMFVSAPIAPKGEATFAALKALHPQSSSRVSAPSGLVPNAPVFTDDRVREALCSFAPTSAAGVFGYRPALLQQCARVESFHFVPTLCRAVNMFARGEAPMFLQPFLAGGVSIALQKNATAIRPLCCGDPIRRLVAKCFCLGGKDEISRTFKGKNFGVGCPGGVEVVAHSLRDVLSKHKSTDMALLKIDFKNAFNLIDRDVFVRA